MPFSLPAPQQLLRRFRDAGTGLPARESAERIVEAVLDHYKRGGEITVLTSDGQNELFRVGYGSPKHGIYGVHIHPFDFHCDPLNSNWHLKAGGDVLAFMKADDYNMFLGKLLQALGAGNYRVGFPKT